MSCDWTKIKTEYITDSKSSYRKLADKYDVPLGTLQKRAKKEKWTELKKQSGDRRVAKSVDAIESKQVDRMTRLMDATDALLSKIEKAINELDVQLVTNTEKVKEIEYKNIDRPDKPTKEIIHESEKIVEVRTIVDRKGIQELASAMKSIKEVQMLKTELDKREQEARIRNLEKQAEDDAKKDTKITVEFEGDISRWSK